MKKTLIGLLVVGGVAVAAALLSKKKEKKYAEVQSPDKEGVEEFEEPESIMEKIDRAAKKMAAWILEREDVMKALGMIMPIVTSVILFLVELVFKVWSGRKAVGKTPNKKDTLDRVIEDMVKNDYKTATVDWNGIAVVDVNMKEVAA